MKGALDWCLRIFLALLPAALVAVGVPHLIDGLAWESAFPVPVYIQMDAPLARKSYESAAQALARGEKRDGESAVFEAEALYNAGRPHAQVLPVLLSGLANSPASARGWCLVSELLMPVDRRGAADALSNSLTLSPNDYYLVDRQLRDAGALWDVLPDDSRQVAINAAPNLWTIPELRESIRPVLRTKGGPELMSKAFRFEPEQLRELNRWVAQRRFQEQSGE